MAPVTDRLRNCCNRCAQAKIRCDSERPACLNCRRRGRSCMYSNVRQSGRPRRNKAGTDAAQGAVIPGQAQRSSRRASRELSPPTSLLTAALPLSTLDVGLSSVSSSRGSSDGLHLFLDDNFTLHPHSSGKSSALDTDLALGGLNLESIHSLSDADMQESLSSDAFDLLAMTTNPSISTDTGAQTHCPEEDAMFLFNEGSYSSVFPSGDSDLDSAFQSLLDDVTTSSSIDCMMNSSLQDAHYGYATGLRKHVAPPKSNLGHDMVCKCHTTLSKLYMVILDPRLSQKDRLPPLDLVLFLEQKWQNIVDVLRQCAFRDCLGVSAMNESTLCLVANWLLGSIQAVLESELNMRSSNMSLTSSWSSTERESSEAHHAPSKSRGGACLYTVSISSMDIRNKLNVGTWSATGESWALCVSAILKPRIQRMQRVLSGFEKPESEASETAPRGSKLQVQYKMAKDTSIRASVVLGMLEMFQRM